ncbi:FADH(2)-dependent monooxygenase TftD [Mycolicibacterium chlorophenolicum]|uniref:FADH(2)-dependent monooxygenase TftD n=1 Tax=Mycolicibacterium chlorophenolicum TaxID=37916 RepID=A0A0J6V9S4_9MYCO|nr:FADH(2)-dependent monooxygenase TftD [Mycolicibacterium chlorophenolicum]
MRTGAEFIASLDDGRRVWVGDELIEDLASHPKTKGYVEAIAKFYDLHHDPEFQDRTTFVTSPATRRPRATSRRSRSSTTCTTTRNFKTAPPS